MTDLPRTGLDLKLARVAARVKQRELGDAFTPPVTESRISAIEREGVVTVKLAERYMAALDTCRTQAAA